MSSLPTIAHELGLSLRSVQRRCERGEIPGAYRAKKRGHWKVDLNRWHEIRRIWTDPAFLRAATKGRDAFYFTLTAKGISNDDLNDLDSLKERDRESYDYICHEQFRVHPKAYDALERQSERSKHSVGMLIMKGERLRLNGQESTTENLARELGVSVPTLHRWYLPQEIRRARGVEDTRGRVDVEVRGQRGSQTKTPRESKKRFEKRFSQADDD
jgi:hypothetical protein